MFEAIPFHSETIASASALEDTYARRFALSAFVGIAPEDDDGRAAVGPSRNVHSGPEMAPREAPRGEWPDGPHASKTALATAWKELVRNLHSATSAEDVEGLIDDAKPTLAQFRAAAKVGILAEDYSGGGDFKGVMATLAEARERVKDDDGTPREAGSPAALVEGATTTQLRESLEACETPAALKNWSAFNAALIGEQPETVRDELRERFKERERSLRAVARMAA